jgi:hypothetical protein
MGTITSRKRKDNATAYTAQIRINRDGAQFIRKANLQLNAGCSGADQTVWAEAGGVRCCWKWIAITG